MMMMMMMMVKLLKFHKSRRFFLDMSSGQKTCFFIEIFELYFLELKNTYYDTLRVRFLV